MIVTEHPTKPFAAPDCAPVDTNAVFRRDQLVIKTLMVPLFVVVDKVFSDRSPQGRFAEEDSSVETFFLDRSNAGIRPDFRGKRKMA